MNSKLQQWQQCKLKDVAYLHKDQVNPVDLGDTLVHHYSIPAFDDGQVPKQESAENIKSNKFSVPPDAVLLSKLNPRFPRVWLPQIDPTIKSLASTEFLILRPQANTDRRFLKFLCTAPVFRSKLLERLTGTSSSHQRVRLDDVLTIEVGIPTLPEQRAIAAILGALDDKIEVNRQMNQTLEAMAQALFKSWFVDFEPFRDEGMEDSPLGEIPRGWGIDKLSKLCTTQYGYTASAIEEPVGPHLLRVTDINKQNWIEWTSVPYCQIEEKNKPKYALDAGDVVVARMADPGKSAIIEQPVDAVFASYLVRLKTESLAHAYYVYGFLKSRTYAEYSEGAMGGSSVQKSMNAKVIVDTDLVIPPRKSLEAFLDYILPLRRRLIANVEQSASLAAIRDTLLPKLLSGEIRVKDAEKFVEVKI